MRSVTREPIPFHLQAGHRRGLDPITLSHTAVRYNAAHGYAEHAVSSPAVAETIAILTTLTHGGMARLSGPRVA